MAAYSLSIDAAGSAKKNARDRNINALFPYTGGSYKTISQLTRRGGIWCNCGGSSQNVTLAVYDQLLVGSTVIKTSDTVTCKCYGTGPSSANYAQTSFSNWTQAQSNAAVAAWAAGTLVIRRFATVTAYSSSKHGSPTFRDGYYSDTVAIQGNTVPFTNYAPVINLFDVFRSDDGVNENPESTSVYAKIKLAINDTSGLSDSPKLRVYYEQDADPTLSSSYLDIASTFGLTAANMGVEKTIQLTGTWSNGADYYFMLYFSAGEEIAEAKLDMAPRAAIPLFVADNNAGVAIGQYSTATAENPKFECRFPAYFYGGIAPIETVQPTVSSGVETPGDYGGVLTFRRIGKLVIVSGSIKLTTAAASKVVCDIPENCIPTQNHYYIAAMTGSKIARFAVGGSASTQTEYAGKLVLEWVKTTGSTSSVESTQGWIDCGTVYWAE